MEFKDEIFKMASCGPEVVKGLELKARIEGLREQATKHQGRHVEVEEKIAALTAQISDALRSGKDAESLIQKRGNLRGLLSELDALPAEIEGRFIPEIEEEIKRIDAVIFSKLHQAAMAKREDFLQKIVADLSAVGSMVSEWNASVDSLKQEYVQGESAPSALRWAVYFPSEKEIKGIMGIH